MKYNSGSADRLFNTILRLSTIEECRSFFEDICTINELLDMSQRLDTAILLDKGLSYQRISEKVNVSAATISRISRCLNYGSNGYRQAIDKMSESEKNI